MTDYAKLGQDLARLDKDATQGPWVHRQSTEQRDTSDIATVAWVADWCVGIQFESRYQTCYDDHGDNESDAAVIVALRNAAPDILRALALAQAVEEWPREDYPPHQLEKRADELLQEWTR